MASPPQESSIVNTQFGLVESSGVHPSAPLTDGDAYKPLLDSNGVLLVRAASGGGLVTTTTFQAPDETGQVVVNAAPCTTGELLFYVRSLEPQYVQIHDSASTVSNGAVPLFVQLVQGERVVYSLPIPIELSSGFVFAVSSTELTFTDPNVGFAVYGSYQT